MATIRQGKVPEVSDLRALEENMHDVFRRVIGVMTARGYIDAYFGKTETS